MAHDRQPPPNPTSQSGLPLRAAYGIEDVPADHRASMGILPGEAPFHRGCFAQGYRTKPWRIFQLSGYGKPEDENERIKFLLKTGETGFLMEHDRNTADHLYNVDHPDVVARREDVGMTGAPMQSVRDTHLCLDGIPIETTYGHAGGAVVQHGPFALAAYWTVARRRGLDLASLPGTGQSDFFLTYLGCVTKQQVPTQAGLRLNADIIEFCGEHLPKWVPVSIAAYNGGDTGLNAYEELGALVANAIEYLDEIRRRGRMDITAAASRCGGVNFRTTMDIFEDAAKLRAARKMWHRLLTERYGVSDERALRLRIHVVTSGSKMTYQQPLNNIVRGTLMALTAVLGGAQSLGVSGYDEALSVPSEHAHQMSVRIQQILQHETNLAAVADPLGGSYYVESLTAELERRAWSFVDEVAAQGGFLATLDSGWLHARARANQIKEFADEQSGRRVVVGVTDFTDDVSPFVVDGFPGVNDAYDVALERLRAVRRERHEQGARKALVALEARCRGSANIMPAMMDALDQEVTLGEIGEVYRAVWGDWQTPELV
ncbi:MAG: acyl-CoA mutase large subunit family protein [Gammaproteobacteria bacterium]|nr:acyl-CoA mutase large subunit family protein [Gammaproteobacteria bacterium]MDE2349465.1 acyl-CoA mutase large subunit family protein [Gammaproteobacteria bacterium]